MSLSMSPVPVSSSVPTPRTHPSPRSAAILSTTGPCLVASAPAVSSWGLEVTLNSAQRPVVRTQPSPSEAERSHGPRGLHNSQQVTDVPGRQRGTWSSGSQCRGHSPGAPRATSAGGMRRRRRSWPGGRRRQAAKPWFPPHTCKRVLIGHHKNLTAAYQGFIMQ